MEESAWVLVPLVAIVGGISYSIVKARAMARVRELEIRERIALIEKGLVPPPEKDPRGFEQAMSVIDRDPFYGRRSPGRHRSAGITLIGVGFGLMFMIGFAGEDPGRAIGIGGFLVVLGVAFYINSLLERREWERSQSSDRSPSSVPPPIPPSHDSVSR